MVDGKEESINSVHFLKTDPKARYQGFSFYFREGFCWNNILNPKARLLKAKLKLASVNDVGSMSLIPIFPELSSKFIIGLLNSNLIFDYYREFVNCTVNIQINDIRQLPIVIPRKEELKIFELLVDKSISIKKSALEIDYETDYIDAGLVLIEKEIDNAVLLLYRI